MMSNAIVRISDWNVEVHPDQTLRLAGRVYGHPSYVNGHYVVTSAITEVRGRFILTASRTYELAGNPMPAYLFALEKEGKSFDPNQPIAATHPFVRPDMGNTARSAAQKLNIDQVILDRSRRQGLRDRDTAIER
jgi:hypothetical protein